MTVRLLVHEDRRLWRNPRCLRIVETGHPVGHQMVISSGSDALLMLMSPLIFTKTHIGQISWRLTGLDNPV